MPSPTTVRPNGYRDYGDQALATVMTIRSFYDLGFPSDLIRTVLPCTTGDGVDQVACSDVIGRVTVIRDEIAERMTHLSRTHATLTGFLEAQDQI